MNLPGLALPLVKTLPPETAHTATLKGLKLGVGLPRLDPAQWHTAITLPKSQLKLHNPVGLAAGFDKNGEVHRQMAGFGFGLIECGTVTPKPQPGNPKPRLFRLPQDGAVINRLGFNNHGLDYFIRRLRRRPPRSGCPVGANVGANKTSADFIADYEAGMTAVLPYADYITINISSPNTPGLRGLQDKSALTDLLARCEANYVAAGAAKPVFLKIAPDLDAGEITAILSSLEHAGGWLAGLIISNTTLARPAELRSADRDQLGGLSGTPLMAKSTDILREFARTLSGQFDLIGCGGVASGEDAYAKIRAGAHAVQLYTALLYQGPNLVAQINRDLAKCLKADGFSQVADAVGADFA